MAQRKEKPDLSRGTRHARWQSLLALVAVLAVAAFLRFYHFDLIEFKSDEALICNLVVDMLESGRPATCGLTSGPGLTNFPMFVYLLALPVALSREPIFLSALIAVTNLVALGLLFWLAAQRWGMGVALWTVLLMATSPWAILYSRKIWAQNVLPLLTVLALFGLLRLLDGDKKRILSTVLCAGVAVMTHLSGACAVLTVIICLVLFRPRVAWKRLGLAILILLLLAGPYLYYQLREGAADRALLGRYLSGDVVRPEHKPTLAGIAGLSLDIINDYGFERLLGEPSSGARPVVGQNRLGSVLGRWIFLAGLAVLVVRLAVGLWTRLRKPSLPTPSPPRDYTVLILWLLVPILVYRLGGALVWTHYFIITLPVPFLIMAMLLEELRRLAGRTRPAPVSTFFQALPIALGLVLAVSGGTSMLQVLTSLEQNGGAPGDYGVALKHKVAAVEHMSALAGGRPIRLVADFQAGRDLPGVEEYNYLIRLRHEPNRSRVDPARPTINFGLIDLFRMRLSSRYREAIERQYAGRQFGPLLVFEVNPAAALPKDR